MPADKYFSKPGMSATLLKAGAVSMLNMHHRATTKIKPTPAMQWGTLMHEAVLEPVKLAMRGVYKGDKKGKSYKEAVAEHGVDRVVRDTDREKLWMAYESVMSHPAVVANALFAGGEAEKECYWDCEHGPCKCKVDMLQAEFMIEYKSCASLEGFNYQCKKLHYPKQLGWYWKGSGEKHVFVVAQESKSPFDVSVFEVPQYDPPAWHQQCLDIYRRYNEYKQNIEVVHGGAYPDLMQLEMVGYDDDDEGNKVMPF